jgi:hypothetical protein
MMLFDWIYPAYTPILHRAVEIWYNDPQVHFREETLSFLSKYSYRSIVNAGYYSRFETFC